MYCTKILIKRFIGLYCYKVNRIWMYATCNNTTSLYWAGYRLEVVRDRPKGGQNGFEGMKEWVVRYIWAQQQWNTYKTPTSVAINMILGRNVVYSEENRHAERRGDRLNGARGGKKRIWNSRRKPKNREAAGQLRNWHSWAKRRGPNTCIHSPYACSEGISNM